MYWMIVCCAFIWLTHSSGLHLAPETVSDSRMAMLEKLWLSLGGINFSASAEFYGFIIVHAVCGWPKCHYLRLWFLTKCSFSSWNFYIWSTAWNLPVLWQPCAHATVGVSRSQRTTFRSGVSPSTMWVLGIKFRSLGLVARAFTYWDISLALLFFLKKCSEPFYILERLHFHFHILAVIYFI